MTIDDIFSRRRKNWDTLIKMRKNTPVPKDNVCPRCQAGLSLDSLKANNWVCQSCGWHLAVTAMDRIEMISDEKSFKEMYADIRSNNPIDFPEYEKKLEINRRKTGQLDAIVTGVCKIDGMRTAVAVLDARFLMGSMGTVVGEKIARLAEYASKRKLPLIIFSASGGARMQEGLFSLMQMAKTAAAIERYKEAGGLFISYLTNPTTGGVTASFAMLGDVILAEPKALIGFAGPRVIAQTIGQKLPEGFQTAEFLLEHGFVDKIVERKNLKYVLYTLIRSC